MVNADLIGSGRTAEVFAWGDGRVLKLFRPGWGKDNAEYEANIAALLYNSGVPCPAVYGVVEHDRRFGVLYERIDGPSLATRLLSAIMDIVAGAQLFAEIHAQIHAISVPGMRSVRQKLARAIERAGGEGRALDAGLRDATLHALAALPDGNALCHGDYHPDNVLIGVRGPLVIDWENATTGHPAADLARAELLLEAYPLTIPDPKAAEEVRNLIELLQATYFDRYEQITGLGRDALVPWRLPIAAARLAEDIQEEESYLLARVAKLAEVEP
jgi:aminoglycoside phosphotransferase (APT) family kinase protein